MARYLKISDEDHECEGCQAEVPAGPVGLTDEIQPGKLLSVCKTCMLSLDRRLAACWITSLAGQFPDDFEAMIGQLLRHPRYCDLGRCAPD